MHLLPFGLLSLLFATQSTALHESDVGIVDWYRPLIGVPDYKSIATAPVFHRVGQKNTQSVVLTATLHNVLAALNPVTGSIMWRHLFEAEDRLISFQQHENVVASLSGPGGATLRSFDVLTGDLILEKRLHHPHVGILSEPSDLHVDIAFKDTSNSTYPDLFVLTNGNTLNHLSGQDGQVKWTWQSPDQSSLVLHSKIITTPSTVYLVGLAKSFASYTLHVTALSSETGELLASANIPSSILRGLFDVLTLKSPAATETNPLLVWLDDAQSLKTLPLLPSLKGKPSSFKGSYHYMSNVGLNDYGQFVIVKPDHSAMVLGISDNAASLKTLWEFEAPTEEITKSLFSGGLDKDRKPYIYRIYWSHVLNMACVEVYASHLAKGAGLLTGFSFPYEGDVHGMFNHVAIDAANPTDMTVLVRMLITTSSGSIQLWQNEKLQWIREESLTTIRIAKFVELPERVITHRTEEEESFTGRVARQLSDAQNFPTYLLNFVKRFATGSYASASSSAAALTHDDTLSRDEFGFRQIIVVATDFGKIFGIDSSTGGIVWVKLLALGWAAQVGGSMHPTKMFVTQTVNEGEFPVVVLITERRGDNGLVDTALFQFNALTGETVLEQGIEAEMLHGRDVVDGPVVDSFFLDTEDSKMVVLIDGSLQVRLFPDTDENKVKFAKLADKLHIPLLTHDHNYPGHVRLAGHQIVMNPALNNDHVAYPTWTFSLPPEEFIQTAIPPSYGPIASLGKVLGNRTTLYKYLNPRLFVVLTATHTHSATPDRCGLYVVDTVKGSIVYHVELPAADGICDVKTTLTENWLVYHYYDGETATGQAKGHQVVSVEFYEGKQVDEKTRSSELSSFSEKILDLTAYEQAYLLPGGITALATTSTKYGISGKDLIVARKNHRIQSFSRRFLNPRRPNRKTTSEEQEEYLVPYEPLLPDDPRRVISHNYRVTKVEDIVTTPALLESTSLVFAHGLDLFLTRVAPSNTFDVLSENFNKMQLVFTVGGLVLAILITKPMVRRKRLREKWYQ